MANAPANPSQGKSKAKVGKAELSAPGVTHLQVRSQVDGFRRAGRAWSVEPVTVPIEDFTNDQIEQLIAEPMLVVLPVTDPSESK